MRSNPSLSSIARSTGLIILATVLGVQSISMNAAALDETFYSNNNILYYDPDACSANSSAQSSPEQPAAPSTSGTYSLTIQNPQNEQYHGDDYSPRNSDISVGDDGYSKQNSINGGIVHARENGFESIDLDLNKSTDGVYFALHRAEAAGKPWVAVDKFNNTRKFKISQLPDLLAAAGKNNIQANIELKRWGAGGYKWTEADMVNIANLANTAKAKATIKGNGDNDNISDALKSARKQGFWVRTVQTTGRSNGWIPRKWYPPATTAAPLDVGSSSATTSSSCCKAPSPASVEGGGSEQNKKAILTYLTNKGMTLAAAAGVAGNIQVESGFDPRNIQDPAGRSPLAQTDSSGAVTDTSTIFKPVDGQGYGLSQWTYGGTFGPRQGPLYNTAVRLKVDIGDLGLQLDYLWKELNTSYKTSTLDRIKTLNDPREAAKIYMVNYEGPADQSAAAQNGRADKAESIFKEYKGVITEVADPTGSPSVVEADASGNCESEGDGGGGIGVANGFTFPLKTTQSALKNGIEGAVWCFSKSSNCHHDYNAADIFVDTGTPIVAAKSGTVVSKKTGSCDYYGCNVSIMGDDGVLYYYTHMHKPATVNEGQPIQAGDRIGSVGTNATAMDTPRHLHFDMLPGNKHEFRPGCSSESCTSYPFMNVQQYLVPAYNALPPGDKR